MKNTTNNNSAKNIKNLEAAKIKKEQLKSIKGGFIVEEFIEM